MTPREIYKLEINLPDDIMKVLFIAGNARSLIANRGDLIRDMKSAGHEVMAIVPDEDMLEEIDVLGIDIYPLRLGRTGLNPFFDMLTIIRLFRVIKSIKPDAVFSYTIKPVVYGSLAARLARVPKVYSMITGLGSTFSESRNFKSKILKLIAVMLYRVGVFCSDKVFFQNPDDMQDFFSLRIVRNRAKAVRTMGSGVNVARFQRAALPSSPTVFLFVARMLKEKGIGEFVASAEIVKQHFPECRFIAVGPFDPSLPHSVCELDMAKWRLGGVVEFVGGVSDVRQWIRESTVFVLPSYYREGTPRSVLEAMSMGRPVITTDSPGCRETVIDGLNGFLVPPRDVSALSSAMMKILRSPDQIVPMAEASYRRILQDYDVQKVNRVILGGMDLL